MKIFKFIIEEIKDQYLKDDREWIIGFSGGKDSTLLLQLTWIALLDLSPEQRTKNVHIVSNDTLVENPIVIDYLEKTLDRIRAKAKLDKLPFIVKKTKPALEDSFWVNLIGKGYPAPISNFRWCTDRLKIHPTTHYIEKQIDKHGEVIVLLGTREDESAQRKKSMKKFEIREQRLLRHPELSLAYIFSPLRGVKNDEVWIYFANNKCPWEGSNNALHDLYSNASSDEYECPTVVTNQNNPSCGTSRFGCWTCTVVKTDKSISAQIQNGETWLKPLYDIRNWLVENRDNPVYRMNTRRNGLEGKGPYTIEKRYLTLEKLLKAQKKLNRELISIQELKSIQIIWNMDGFLVDAFKLYNEISQSKINHIMRKSDSVKQEQTEKLKKLCDSKNLDFEMITRLLIEERNKNMLRKRNNIQQIIEKEFDS